MSEHLLAALGRSIDAARESARRGNGQFGTQARTEADHVDLHATPTPDPANPFRRLATLRDLTEAYEGASSPENLNWDGERDPAEARRAYAEMTEAFRARRREIDPSGTRGWCVVCKDEVPLGPDGYTADHDRNGRVCFGSGI